jgi:AraC family transcriptional regulator, arabinose operon regulatory protein
MDYLLICTMGGAGQVWAEGSFKTLGVGSLLLFEKGVRQDYRTDPVVGQWDLAWAHFHPRPGWLPLLRWPQWKPGVRLLRVPDGGVRSRILGAAAGMAVAFRLPVKRAAELALNRLDELLLWADGIVRGDAALHADPRILGAMDRLTSGLDRPFDLGGAARSSGLSVSRFCQLFKAVSGETPQRFSERARLNHAMFLLRESVLTASEVAAQCGYDDPLYFSRRFRKWFGAPPTAFRSKTGK